MSDKFEELREAVEKYFNCLELIENPSEEHTCDPYFDIKPCKRCDGLDKNNSLLNQHKSKLRGLAEKAEPVIIKRR